MNIEIGIFAILVLTIANSFWLFSIFSKLSILLDDIAEVEQRQFDILSTIANEKYAELDDTQKEQVRLYSELINKFNK